MLRCVDYSKYVKWGRVGGRREGESEVEKGEREEGMGREGEKERG